jgi:hypothetical protein
MSGIEADSKQASVGRDGRRAYGWYIDPFLKQSRGKLDGLVRVVDINR